MKRNFLLCASSWERPYSTSCFNHLPVHQRLAAEEIDFQVPAVSGIGDQEIQRFLANLKAHQRSASMILALFCKAVLTGKVAVMRDMQAECLDNRLALLEIHNEVFVNVSGKEFFLIDELLNVLKRLSDLFLAVFLF